MARGQFVPPSAWVMTLFVVWPRNLHNLHNLVRWSFHRIDDDDDDYVNTLKKLN